MPECCTLTRSPTQLSWLKGRAAREQRPSLQRIVDYNGMDFILEVRVQRVSVLLNFTYWVRTDYSAEGRSVAQKARLLESVCDIWTEAFPGLALPGSDELQALRQTLKQ